MKPILKGKKILFCTFIILLFSSTINVNSQNFSYPLPNTGWYLSQDFGVWNSKFNGYHLGEDYVSNSNEELPVYAVSQGKVKHVQNHTSYGYVVIIEHLLNDNSKVCSVYGHMRAANITTVEKSVTKGELIGYLSNNSTENGGYNFTHLHFGIRSEGYSTALDSDGYWRYRGYGSSNTRNLWYDPGNYVANHQNISALTLSSPNDKAEFTKGKDISFNWSTIANAVYYEIWIDNSNAFGSPEVGFNNGESTCWLNDGIVSTNIFTLSTSMQNQLPQNVYYWKVRALNSSKAPISDWSSNLWNFSLLDPISSPTLSSPNDKVELTKGNDILFNWSIVPSASYYEIWIDNSNVFGSPEVGFNNGESTCWLNDGIVSTNKFTLSTSMQNQLPQNVYYWKVRALNSNKIPITDWSNNVWNFSLLDPISSPTLSSPNNQAKLTKGNDILFNWLSIANASYYEIWIDNSNVFGSPEVGFNNGESTCWLNNGIVNTNKFTLSLSMQNQLPQNVYYWKVRALNSNKVPITEWSNSVWNFSLLDDDGSILDELNGSTIGIANGITYIETPYGQGAVFSRSRESRIEYPFSMGLPHEGTIEMLIKVSKAYQYENFALRDNHSNAFIFNTGPSDVWYLGAMWLTGNNLGEISLTTALTATPTAHTLSASTTNFRFNEWHILSFSYGSQGQYLKVDGQIVASNSNYKETLQTCGNWDSKRNNPTIGEMKSVFWSNNQYDQGIEGILDKFRFSSKQQDWALFDEISNLTNTNESSINIYPNPVSEELIIESVKNEKISFDIINSIGQIVYKGNLLDKTTVNTSNFNPGIYIVKLKVGKVYTYKKILKK